MFYPIIIGLPLVHTAMREYIKNNGKDVPFIAVMAFLLSIRTGTGNDIATYEIIFQKFCNGGSIFDAVSHGEGFEIGFAVVNFFIARMGMPFNVVLFFFAVFNLYSIFYFLDHIEIKNKVLGIFVYVMIFDIYVYSLSAIRQTLAISFYMLAIIALKEGKKRKAIWMVICGTLFHWSIVIMLPFLYFVQNKTKARISSLVFIAIISPFIYLILIDSILVKIIAGLKYNLEYYLIILNGERFTNITKCVIFMVITITFVFFLASFRKMDRNGCVRLWRARLYSYNRLDILDWSMFFFLVTKEWLAIGYMSALPRLQMYWYFLLPFWIGRLITKMKGQARYVATFAIVVVLVFMFMGTMKENSDAFINASFSLKELL